MKIIIRVKVSPSKSNSKYFLNGFKSVYNYILYIFFLVYYNYYLSKIFFFLFIFIFYIICSICLSNPLLCDDGSYDPSVVVNMELAVPGKRHYINVVLPPMRDTPDGAVAMNKYIKVYNNDIRDFEIGTKQKLPQVQMYASTGPRQLSIQDKLNMSMRDILKR